MIDVEKVNKIGDIFIGYFIELNIKENPPTFLEVLLGFMYAVEKIKRALEKLDILSKEDIFTMTKEIKNSVGVQIDERIKSMLKNIKEEKNG